MCSLSIYSIRICSYVPMYLCARSLFFCLRLRSIYFSFMSHTRYRGIVCPPLDDKFDHDLFLLRVRRNHEDRGNWIEMFSSLFSFLFLCLHLRATLFFSFFASLFLFLSLIREYDIRDVKMNYLVSLDGDKLMSMGDKNRHIVYFRGYKFCWLDNVWKALLLSFLSLIGHIRDAILTLTHTHMNTRVQTHTHVKYWLELQLLVVHTGLH